MSKNVAGTKVVNRRYLESPMVGVGAVIFREGKVLIIQRGNEPSLGRWSLPGGLVEVGESLEEAIRREVLEEVGLKVDVKDLLVVLDRVILDDQGRVEYHYILLDFLCEAKSGVPAPATDVMACAFASLGELPSYDLTEGTEEIIRRAFDQYKSPYPIYDPRI